MAFRPAIGRSDFRILRREGRTYVDKTALVGQVLRSGTPVLLFPRPRRFGKTLNLSMLRYFLERHEEDRADLFEGLDVWTDPEARGHFQRHPVLMLTFKDVGGRSWTDCQIGLRKVVERILDAQAHILSTTPATERELRLVQTVAGRDVRGAELVDALEIVSGWLARATGEPVILLIDEYDTPIHAGFVGGYYEEVIDFFRSFLSVGLKDNVHIYRAVVTGILRVAKESIFSGLNNLSVYDILCPEFATSFGFTEPEVGALIESAGAEAHREVIRSWYNGYLFGGRVVYNPWSVLNFLDRADRVARPYWVNTSSNDLVHRLLTQGGAANLGDLEVLLNGGTIDKLLEDSIALRDLDKRSDAVWSLLLFTGYLNATDVRHGPQPRARLSIPNVEVSTVYHRVFRNWMEAGLGSSRRVEDLLRALLSGDAEELGFLLGELLETTLSYHDTARGRAEHVYYAFFLGLLVNLEESHEVRSNRESGYGRADVLVTPREHGRPGVVLELKTVREGSAVEQTLDAAERQIRERDYAASVRASGADPVHQFAVAFDGKRAWVRRLGAQP